MPDLEHLHPEFRRRVESTGHAVYSGARSHARQAQLYQDYLNGTGNAANPPGKSWHEYDEGAAWPNPNSETSNLVGGAYALAVDFDGPPYPHGAPGLIFPIIADEPWHAQPSEIGETSRTADAWRRLPLPATDDGFTPDDFALLHQFAQLVGGTA